MSQTTNRAFTLISDDEPKPVTAQAAPQAAASSRDSSDAARQLLFVALRALSQRTLTAVTNLFSLVLVALTFVLSGRVLDDPTPYRLAAVGGFAVFSLLIDIVRRRSK